MNVPRTSAESGQSQPAMGVETGSGRGRTVTTACERCRRRKIRCDGETPCATCRRFRISCVRIQKNDTQALEQRVRQLEAQIADFNTQNHGHGHGSGPVGLPSPQAWSPDVQFNVDFGSPGPAVAMDQTFSQFHPGSPSPLEIPSIQVVDYADSMSPVSPVSLSPSPMLRPLAPAGPNPISDGLGTGLRPPSAGAAVSPPPTAIQSPHHGLMPYLSPRSLPGPSRSRSSSISSLGLDTDWASAPDLSVYGLTDTELEPGIFEIPSTPDAETLHAPTRFEAETLIDKFFLQMQMAAYPLAHYPLDRSKLHEFLNIIHQQVPPLDAVHDWSCSESMARFHVYMAMAVSLRMEKDGRSSTLNLLQKCYLLALRETQEPSFWKQAFAQEAAVLFLLFAQVSAQEYP